MEAMEVELIPSHRLSLLRSLNDNKYIETIRSMREDTRDSKHPHSGKPLGPIGDALQRDALQSTPTFAVSASEWTREHLTRFQIVVLQDRPSSDLFPDEYIIKDNDKTMKALKDQKFFAPDVTKIGNGEWDHDSIHHVFFTHLMVLLRGGDRTPSPPTSPPQRAMQSRDAKEKAIYEIMRVNSNNVSSHSLPSRPSSGSNPYRPSMSSIDSRPVVDYGPRETATFTMMHDFLISLGTTEFKAKKSKFPPWITNANSSRYPVVAAGHQFNAENDGSIHAWTRRKSGLRKQAVLPLCSLEFKREWHLKSEYSIFAQEAAELIALASQNFVSEKPLSRPRDETFLICCRSTTVHISAAIISDEYIQGITEDKLEETQYLLLKRGEKCDLLDPIDRRRACRQILGLLRYLTRTPEN